MVGRSPDDGSEQERPWYADGLRFECLPNCGVCCTSHGDYEYLYLNDDDVVALACHFGLEPAEFERRYTALVDGWTVLRMGGPDCRFLDGARCTVYAARPTQCRTFPFWPENLKDRSAWERLGKFCPGIGRGRKRSLLSIGSQLAATDA